MQPLSIQVGICCHLSVDGPAWPIVALPSSGPSEAAVVGPRPAGNPTEPRVVAASRGSWRQTRKQGAEDWLSSPVKPGCRDGQQQHQQSARPPPPPFSSAAAAAPPAASRTREAAGVSAAAGVQDRRPVSASSRQPLGSKPPIGQGPGYAYKEPTKYMSKDQRQALPAHECFVSSGAWRVDLPTLLLPDHPVATLGLHPVLRGTAIHGPAWNAAGAAWVRSPAGCQQTGLPQLCRQAQGQAQAQQHPRRSVAPSLPL